MGQGAELAKKPLCTAVVLNSAEARFHLCDAEAREAKAAEADALAEKAEAEALSLRAEAQTWRNMAAIARARATQ